MTAEGDAFTLPAPFMVVATQNPIAANAPRIRMAFID
ncbi:MAG: AAA family ATPase [Proteobacteria bacterium]|nr:AAA family ATPase [Pseudomonadota bacterium]